MKSVGASDPGLETLAMAFNDLSSKSNQTQVAAAERFRRFMEKQSRKLTADKFERLASRLTGKIIDLVNVADVQGKIGGIMVIGMLTEQLAAREKMVVRIATCFHRIFQQSSEPSVLEMAARALGHLTRHGSGLCVEIVNDEVGNAFRWLESNKHADRRLAAVLLLREFAKNTPTLFNIHVQKFLKNIWVALSDRYEAVRFKARDALSACMEDIGKRKLRWRQQCHRGIYETARNGLQNVERVPRAHGSLLAIGQLLDKGKEFMSLQFKDATELVLRACGTKNQTVQQTIIALLPRLASLSPGHFAEMYLKTGIEFVIAAMKSQSNHPICFITLGELATAVGPAVVPYLDRIISLVKEGLQTRRNLSCESALTCFSKIAQAPKIELEIYADEIIDAIFEHCELSRKMVQALAQLIVKCPSRRIRVQDRLLSTIAGILAPSSKKNFQPPDTKAIYASAAQTLSRGKKKSPLLHPLSPMSVIASLTTSQSGMSAGLSNFSLGPAMTSLQNAGFVEAVSDSARAIVIALETLGTFNFSNLKEITLLRFSSNTVLPFLNNDRALLRREAAMALCKLILSMPESIGKRRHTASLTFYILKRVATVAIADPESSIRLAVLKSMKSPLDKYACQVEILSILIPSLNDEVLENRKEAITLLGRLSQADHNPAHALPPLRKLLIQLLAELQQFGCNNVEQEDSAALLGHLLYSCPNLIRPFVPPIAHILVNKLQTMGLEKGIAAKVLELPSSRETRLSWGVGGHIISAIGQLASASPDDFTSHLEKLLPFVIDALQDETISSAKRMVAVRTLGQLVQGTGYSIQPYEKYPKLLPALLNAVRKERSWSTRREVMRTLGILGARDPLLCRDIEPSRRELDCGPDWDIKGTLRGEKKSGLASNEKFYAMSAISSLLEMLRSSQLRQHHSMVIQAIMFIFQGLGPKCHTFLPQTIPLLLSTLRSCEANARESFLVQLNCLVRIVGIHISDFVEEIVGIVADFWKDTCNRHLVLNLLEDLSHAIPKDLNHHLPLVIPEILETFQTPQLSGAASLIVLRTLETLARNGNLNSFLPMVISSLTSVFELPHVEDRVIQKVVITLTVLCEFKEVTDYACRLLHPFARVVKRFPQHQERIMEAVCTLILTMGSEFLTCAPIISSIAARCKEIKDKPVLRKYKLAVSYILKSLQERRNKNLVMAGCHIVGQDAFIEEITALSLGLDASAITEIKSSPVYTSPNSPKGVKMSPYMESKGGGKPPLPPPARKEQRLKVNQENLRQAWNAQKRHRREDWHAWIRGFAIELLKESPSPALRACSELARKYRPLARQLFNPAFISCWNDLADQLQDQLIHHLELALQAVNIPHDVAQLLLSLMDFMERQDTPLLVDVHLLGALAERFHAYAKALHYRELEFQTSPTTAIEKLISINNHLQEPQSAQGLLKYARMYHSKELKTSWYEKLEHWGDALEEYELKQLQHPTSVEIKLARARCLHALGKWERVVAIGRTLWRVDSDEVKATIAPLAAAGAWNLGEWEWLEKLVDRMNPGDESGSFFWALHAVHNNAFKMAERFIDRARDALDVELRALLGESYSRAYRVIVKVQQLAELEEVIQYKKAILNDSPKTRDNIRKTWSRRLHGVQKKVGVWQQILSIRRLVVSPREDIDTWSRHANLCRKSGRLGLSGAVLTSLLSFDPVRLATQPKHEPLPTHNPQVIMTALQHLWSAGFEKEAKDRLDKLLNSQFFQVPGGVGGRKRTERETKILRLQARCYLKRGQWEMALFDSNPASTEAEYTQTVKNVLKFYQLATQYDSKNQKAWHAWARMNYQVISHYKKKTQYDRKHKHDLNKKNKHDLLADQHVVPAIQGFFKSIQLQRKGQRLQDILRLLHLWFEHGSRHAVHKALVNRFESISIDVWLDVIPQIIARITTPDTKNRTLVQELLCRIGKAHPQNLIYPLAVASKSPSKSRRKAALNIFDNMRQHYPVLVDQSLLVSGELIRVAILWHEQWQEAIEEASRLWFGEQNFHEMYYSTLLPLHKRLAAGPSTVREQQFFQVYGSCLQTAYERCKAYAVSQRAEDITRAWDYYSTVFRKLSKEVQKMKELELNEVSPKLLSAKDMVLAVPGTYEVGGEIVSIAGFVPTLKVIDSKQHPRKLKIRGSDGNLHTFLLKGHEDLRQDERVMQLFGLVNSFLAQDRETGQRDLSIRRYAVIPLSVQSGLIEWVPHCDTVHLLIKEYRDRQKILLNIEQRIMAQMAPDYQTLSLIQKIEVFQRALSDTKGEDLAKVFRLHSPSAESWLARRSNYTRSLAVMSMVGYILGLGDRHPCNLMLCRRSGKIVHIDFGDCFEVAMHREKFPEKIPFRLTRMLVNAMEVSGIEGIFRFTCEAVMRVLRGNKESVMAVLEAFVYDPLINWRLLDTRRQQKEADKDFSEDDSDSSDEAEITFKQADVDTKATRAARAKLIGTTDGAMQRLLSTEEESISAPYRGSIMRAMINQQDRALNTQAVRVISRVENKLTGRDFSVSGQNVLDIRTQVQALILQATSHKNLCQCYIGWCPFW